MAPRVGMSFQLRSQEDLTNLPGMEIKYLCDGMLVDIKHRGLSVQNVPAKGIFEIEKVEKSLIFSTCGRVFDRVWTKPVRLIKAGTQVLFRSSQVRQATEKCVMLRSDRGVDYAHDKSTLHNLIIDCYTGNGWYKLTTGRKVFHRWLVSTNCAPMIVKSKKYEPATEEDLEKAEERLNTQAVLSPEKHRKFMQRGECLHPQRFQSEIDEKIALAREEYHEALATKKQCGMIYNIFGLPMPKPKIAETVPYVSEDNERCDWWSENIRKAETTRRAAQHGRIQL